jgi:hypothetical protein
MDIDGDGGRLREAAAIGRWETFPNCLRAVTILELVARSGSRGNCKGRCPEA